MNYKKIIKAKGLKQSWLAKKIGVSNAMMSRVVNEGHKLSYEKQYMLEQLLK